MTRVGRFRAATDHPALPGHFPGAPVLPGVVLLDHVLAALLEAHPGRRAAELAQAKFLRPVRPGDEVDILADPERAGRIGFVCRVGPDPVATGTVRLNPAP